MRPSTVRRFSIATLFVTLACLAGAAGGGFLLYQDLNAGGSGGRGTPMATLTKREAKVRRKPSSSFVWQNAQLNETLYRKESIQTGESSAAVVKLNSGSELEVGENSLIVLDNVSDLSLNFLHGSVVVKDATGQNSRITIGKDGKRKVEILPYQLIAPEPLARFFVPPGTAKSLEFAWGTKAPDPDAKPVMQISSDRNFRNGATKTLELTKPVGKLVAKLDPGEYYWRISDRGNVVSDVRRFALYAPHSLKPIWPIDDQKVPRYAKESSVQFRWISPAAQSGLEDSGDESGATSFGKHEIQVATDPGFKNTLLTQSVSEQAGLATRNGLPDGNLYWRIRSQYGDVAVASPPQKFFIEKQAKVEVELNRPDEGGSVELRPELRFSWSCEASNVSYRLDLLTPDGKVAQSFKTQSSSYVWKNPIAGRYKWRVAAIDGEQTAGESPPRELSIYQGQPLALKAPAKDSEIYYWETPTEFNFEWAKDTAESYEIDVSHDPTFKTKTHSEKLTDTSISSSKFELPSGTYFWRVRALDATGQTVKASDPQKFAYGVHPPLRAPASVMPAPGTSINILDNKLPTLTWSPVENAQGYDVTVFRDKKPVFHETTDTPSVELKDLKAGNYTWTVRAIDPIKRRGESAEIRNFALTYGGLLQAPESVTPEVQ